MLARICLTHSHPVQNVDAVFRKWDCSDEEYKFVKNYLENIEYSAYDKLIQLCDALALLYYGKKNDRCCYEKWS